MSVSWTYFSRRFMLQSYRDWIAMTIIGTFCAKHMLVYTSTTSDNNWALVTKPFLIITFCSKEYTLMMRLTSTTKTGPTRPMVPLGESE